MVTKSLVIVVESKLDDSRIGVDVDMDVECVLETWKAVTIEIM
jgi:hypothetical protein